MYYEYKHDKVICNHQPTQFFSIFFSFSLVRQKNRFVGPFLNLVQSWERRLALISEIIDEWIATQRKWMYLEGIFIGGDIRAQLPEEAAKFDTIDVQFRNVSKPHYHQNTKKKPQKKYVEFSV